MDNNKRLLFSKANEENYLFDEDLMEVSKLIQQLQNSEDWFVVVRVAEHFQRTIKCSQLIGLIESLKPYLLDLQEHLSDEFEKKHFRYEYIYEIVWHCAQNMSYPDFYNAWYQVKGEKVSLNQLDLLQRLQAAININAQLSKIIHLIYIDTSKFIDLDNPAGKIYTAIVKASYPKCEDGVPKTMAELQTYWDLLETDKRVVLVFHPGSTNNTDRVTYSDRFLNDISKFEGAICFMSNPIPDHNTLNFFPPSQPINEILEWLQRS